MEDLRPKNNISSTIGCISTPCNAIEPGSNASIPTPCPLCYAELYKCSGQRRNSSLSHNNVLMIDKITN